MVVSLLLALLAIRRREFPSHGAWMMRAYAIGLGAGTQVLIHMPWFILVNKSPDEVPLAVMMGAGWVINLIVAEWIIRRARSAPPGAPLWSHRRTIRMPLRGGGRVNGVAAMCRPIATQLTRDRGRRSTEKWG